MPRECLAYVKFKDGHLQKVVEVSISKVPPHFKKALHKAIDAKNIAE